MEKWENLDWCKDYMVSSFGNIKSYKYGRETIRKHGKDRDGYSIVSLWKNNKGKTFKVHRLVAEAFIPNPFGKPEVNHINGDKSDNRVENLEWCTRSENELHAYKNSLKEAQAKGKYGSNNPKAKPIKQFDLKGNLIKVWGSSIEAANSLGVSRSNICQCLKGRQKTCRNYIWRYEDEETNLRNKT